MSDLLTSLLVKGTPGGRAGTAGAELRRLQLGAAFRAPGAGAGRLRGGKNREGPEARPAGVSGARHLR